jgi:hypothetical protein
LGLAGKSIRHLEPVVEVVSFRADSIEVMIITMPTGNNETWGEIFLECVVVGFGVGPGSGMDAG